MDRQTALGRGVGWTGAGGVAGGVEGGGAGGAAGGVGTSAVSTTNNNATNTAAAAFGMDERERDAMSDGLRNCLFHAPEAGVPGK